MDKPARKDRHGSPNSPKKEKEKKSHKHKKEPRSNPTEAKAPDDLCTLIVGAGPELGAKLTAALPGAVACAWTDLNVNTTADAVNPQVFLNRLPIPKPRLYLVPLDTPRIHLGEGGTGLANSVYGFIYSSIRSINSMTAVFELSEYAVTLAELNRLRRAHGDAFPVQNISYFSNGIALNFLPDPPILVTVASSAPGVGRYIIRSHEDIADVRSILALHNHYVTVSVVFPLRRLIRLRAFGDAYTAFECNSTQQWDSGAARLTELTDAFKGWLRLIAAGVHGGLNVFGVEAIETDKGRLLIRDVDVRPDLLFPCAQTLDEDVAAFARFVRTQSEAA